MSEFKWNYEEEAENQAELEVQKKELLSANPNLQFFLAAHNDAPIHNLILNESIFKEITPSLFPNLPPNLGLTACALTNKNLGNLNLWIELFKTSIEREKFEHLIIEALGQIMKRLAPIKILPSTVLKQSLLEIGGKLNREKSILCTELLIDLFRIHDLEHVNSSEAHFSSHCRLLLEHQANPHGRNKTGESPLSAINSQLIESEISMANSEKINDLLLCAQILLENGASAESVRVHQPLNDVVPNNLLRGLLASSIERSEIEKDLAYGTTNATQHKDTTKKSKRI